MRVELSEKRNEGGRQRELNKIGVYSKIKKNKPTPKPENTRQQVRKWAKIRKNG